MLLALLIAASTPAAVDAERAFAADAQALGQWTAFRKWSDDDAVMFTPQAAWARDYLKDRKDPPQSVRWWPEQAISSCDGRTAVTTGPSLIPGSNTTGGFTTVWQQGEAGWKWVYDAGDRYYSSGRAPKTLRVHQASCSGRPSGPPVSAPPALTNAQARTTPSDNGRGASADSTLGWEWRVRADGVRELKVYMWNGERYNLMLDQTVKPR